MHLVKYQCFKETVENNTSVTTHFKKLTLNNVFIVSVIVKSNCHILRHPAVFLRQMFNVSAYCCWRRTLKIQVLFSVVAFKTL